MKKKYSSSEIISRFIELNQCFLSNTEHHNPAGFQSLMKERRDLLVQLNDEFQNERLSDNDENLLERFLEGEKALEKIIRNLQQDIGELITGMNVTKVVFRRYKSRTPKLSLFIDKKR